MEFSLEKLMAQLAGMFGGDDQQNGLASNGIANSGVAGGDGIMLDASGNLINSKAPGFDPTGKIAANTGLGWNQGTLGLGLGAIGTGINMFGANRALGLAEDQFKLTKATTNTNLNNQIKSYNTALEDRITARAAMQGNDASYAQDYMNKNRLTR